MSRVSNRIPELIFAFFLFAGTAFYSCIQNSGENQGQQYVLTLPPGFPAPAFPDDNPLTIEGVQLGKKLFFEKALSRDSSVSCASCHIPSTAFADNRKISVGIKARTGKRNVPSLGNIGYHPYFFREGGNPTLEMQLLGPIQNHEEMDLTIYEAVERLKNDPVYRKMAEKAYRREMDAFVLSRAIASFERTIISGNSKFDRYFYQKEPDILNASELKGLALFFSESLACRKCHSGHDFSDYSMQNVGLYKIYNDEGLMRVTSKPADSGKFKVPSLRNVALTAPYMHDGSLPDLEEVIEHFNHGGKGHSNQSPLVKQLNLSESEKSDLIAFLHTLTDSTFINNINFKPNK